MAEELRLKVRVKPRAAKSRVLGPKDDTLEVAVAAPPVDGAANEELIRTLAAHYGVPKRAVEILSGETARIKLVRVVGVRSRESGRR
ncbi:MAG TPA: DUF167 domain-containing protein [Polyangiaceae bacterium]|jgi:uncharacterized protein (TIGR00251 family)|nr:DUF167 domain-containing protein [Polyangiaceae bacterium]